MSLAETLKALPILNRRIGLAVGLQYVIWRWLRERHLDRQCIFCGDSDDLSQWESDLRLR